MTKYLNLSRQEIKRVTFDLVSAELSRLRGNQLIKNEEDIRRNLDSLEILTIASAVNQFFCLYEVGLEDNLLRFSKLDEWVDIIETSLMHFNQALTFLTSGSTGNPKRQRHYIWHLFSETRLFANLFYKRRRVISFVPSHHLYGFLFTVLLPKELNIPLIRHTEISLKELQKGDLIIATPIQWQYIQKTVTQFPTDVVGVTSTSPCPIELSENLKTQGLTDLYEIYGSTETSGVGYRKSYKDFYKLLDHWQKGDKDNELLLCINPDDCDHNECDEMQIFILMNHLHWQHDIYFNVGERIDQAIKIGGINVYPSHIEAIINTHPCIKECAIRSYTLSDGYTRLKAFIVPKDDSLTEEDVFKYLSDKLTSVEQPKQLTFGSELPRNDIGKLTNW